MDVQPVVVGIDGSRDSRRALRWAVEYGQRYEAPVHALTAWDMPPNYWSAVVSDEEEYASLQAKAHTLQEDTVRDVLGEQSQVVKRVERGHPAETLITAAESAQLLVVGTRGHGAFVGMLIGSVSQHCVHHAHCPVVVVPPERP